MNMKRVVFFVVFFLIPTLVIAGNVNTDYVLNKIWQGRRIVGVEQTLWRVQDYVQTDKCQDVLEVSCYKEQGKEKHLAQSLLFDEGGKYGVWFQFFAPKKVKNKGADVRILPSNLVKSPRFFCRGGRLSRGGARRIAEIEAIINQKPLNGTNVTWAMMLMQTGAYNFNDRLFAYDISYDIDGYAIIVKAKSKDKLPSHTIYVNDKDAIERIEFLNKKGEVVWIVYNMEISYSGGNWQPTKVLVVNVVDKKATLMQIDKSLSFNKWKKTYNQKALSCGK